MYDLVRTAIAAIMRFVYPPRCALCDTVLDDADAASRWCIPCARSLRRLEGDFTAVHLDRVWFDRARSVVSYEGPIRDAIHGFKYGERLDLTRVFVELLDHDARWFGPLDMVVPVPLHPARLRRRGYNQAALIARGLARRLLLPCDTRSLVRVREVGPQVERERKGRLTAVKGIFHVRRPHAVKKRRVLLIDDVLTTGATVNECARALKKAGATGVYVLTIARTL